MDAQGPQVNGAGANARYPWKEFPFWPALVAIALLSNFPEAAAALRERSELQTAGAGLAALSSPVAARADRDLLVPKSAADG